MSDCYDRKGKPISLMEWANLGKDKKNKIVKQEQIGRYFVSTVWLGLDHNFMNIDHAGGRPLIFETMVFDREGNGEYEQERYSTEEEAIRGHERIAYKYRRTIWVKVKEKMVCLLKKFTSQ